MAIDKRWMLYGANGYSGELIARDAVGRGEKPILAGRNAAKIEMLAGELGLEHRVFDLTDSDRIAKELEDVSLVLLCAGPFSATSAPMIEACIGSGTHYLDITGEIAVFEHAFSKSTDAASADVVLCPGVGFDVVPTDCVAVALKESQPDATHLTLAFESGSGLSPGTAKTMVEGLGSGGAVRENGRIKSVPQAYRDKLLDCGRGETRVMTIPWGDVSTAFHSTGIPNIEVYTAVPGMAVRLARGGNHLGVLWRRERVIGGLKGLIGRFVEGPDAESRARYSTYVYGQVRNSAGETKTARIITASGYDVTTHAPLAIIGRLLEAGHEGGTLTPGTLMGPEFVTTLPGSSSIRIENEDGSLDRELGGPAVS